MRNTCSLVKSLSSQLLSFWLRSICIKEPNILRLVCSCFSWLFFSDSDTGGTVEAAEDTMGAEETEDTGGQTPQGPRSPQPGPSTSGGQGPQGHSVVTSIGPGVSVCQS